MAVDFATSLMHVSRLCIEQNRAALMAVYTFKYIKSMSMAQDETAFLLQVEG